ARSGPRWSAHRRPGRRRGPEWPPRRSGRRKRPARRGAKVRTSLRAPAAPAPERLWGHSITLTGAATRQPRITFLKGSAFAGDQPDVGEGFGLHQQRLSRLGIGEADGGNVGGALPRAARRDVDAGLGLRHALERAGDAAGGFQTLFG